jgi:Ni,Fe-hydrogenase III large subunit
MTVWNKRSTQKIVTLPSNMPSSDVDKIEDMEVRMKSIEQSLNLILQKLDNGNDNGNNISSISK